MKKANRNSGAVRRTESQWSALLEQHRQSGLTQVAFCEAHGLAISSFTSALRRAREVGFDVARANAFVPVLVEGVAEHVSSSVRDVELTLGAGIVLRIRGV